MDFSKLETRKYYDVAQFLHLRHGVLGHLLYADGDEIGRAKAKSAKPIGLKVFHVQSSAHNKFMADVRKGAYMGDIQSGFWDSLIAELINFPDGLDKNSISEIFGKTPEFENQFDAFVADSKNFFEKPAA